MAKNSSTKAGLPSNFLWGFATAAYQIEGAVTADGRGPSIWDTFCKIPGKIKDGTSADVACDSYNRTAEDIALLKSLGAKVYRFSISWPRIIPLGGRNDPVNQKGIDHYVKFVDDLLVAGIVPFVTLFHWDLPDELYKRYEGFLNKDEFVADFTRYVKVVFEALGSKVKNWITFNEPFIISILGHTGVFAPGRTSDRALSPVGDSSTEPWIAGHSILVAHAYAVDAYRNEFQAKHGGEIGITLNGDWTEPYDVSSEEDKAAALRRREFGISWFADPIYFGHYPESMVAQLGSRLPTFTETEIKILKGSNEFFGLNHYSTTYVKALSGPAKPEDFLGNLELLFENKNGDIIGPETGSPWFRPYAPGFRKLLQWLDERYGHPKIYVTENGTSIKGENDLTRDEILKDDFRLTYYKTYIRSMAEAVAEDGVDCRGYMAWSLMDNFEWADGFENRFGVTYVDYKNEQKRYPKQSAKALKDIFDQYIGKV